MNRRPTKSIARPIKQFVERFAETGAGNIKRLQEIDPPEFRLRVGDYRVRNRLCHHAGFLT